MRELDNSGVYDMAYTPEEGHAGPSGTRIRRFFSEQELSEFLKKHLNLNSLEVGKLMSELHQSGRARVRGITLPDELEDLAA